MIDATPLVPIAPLTLGENNVWPYRVDGRGWLFVDAGLAYTDGGVTSWDAIVAQARAIGCEPSEVRAVIVTHEHIDHAGLAARWAQEGAAIIAMPEAMLAITAGGAFADALRARRLEELRRHGCPRDVLDVLGAQQRAFPLDWPACPADALVPAQDGDTFALDGGRMLHVLAAPGHTPGNLVAFVAEREGATTGELCSGDTLLPTTIPTPGLQFPAILEGDADAPRWPSLPPFLRSVQRLSALGVRRILPGHGPIVDDPRRLLAQFTEHHARRAARILAALEATPGVTAYEVTRALFPRLPAPRIGQAMTEVVGHLDVLVERAAAQQQRDSDGVVRTRLVR